jgi:hypothetical protein
MKVATGVLCAAVLMSGCGNEAPPDKSAAAQVAKVAEPTPAPPMPPIGDSVLSVKPGSFRGCEAEDGAIEATATWDVSGKGITDISIYVSSPGNPPKLWLEGGPSGQSTTGDWVFDQTKFSLVARKSKKTIAELIVKAVPCP